MDKRVILIGCLVALMVVVGVIFYMNQDSKETTDNNTQNSSQEAKQEDVREVVWKQLTSEQQESIVWQDGKLSKITLDEGAIFSDGNKIVKVDKDAGKEVYFIDFTTDRMAIPNNMIVYADIDTLAIIGYGLVD